MGIVNCTPDSFYPASRRCGHDNAVGAALAMEKAGAGVIDLGGESTRPGAAYVSEAEELERVIPVIAGIRKVSGIPLSVDTRKAAVAEAALEAGCSIINDISAGEDDPRIINLAARTGAYLVLMHKQGAPETMQNDPRYQDVVTEVGQYLERAADRAVVGGVARSRIIVDPGLGFGKRFEDNIALLSHLPRLRLSGIPLLVGLSRKSFIGKILDDRPVEGRLAGTLAATFFAIMRGADILRVHDVQETVDLVRVGEALSWNG
jgi:dihydropteroate synthase